jgi:hypothetical protein
LGHARRPSLSSRGGRTERQRAVHAIDRGNERRVGLTERIGRTLLASGKYVLQAAGRRGERKAPIYPIRTILATDGTPLAVTMNSM